jgi:hypothetical protein
MARPTSKTLKPGGSAVSNPSTANAGERVDQPTEGDSLALYEFTAAERHARIAEVAYRLAERRGFASGSDTADWLEAEREVDAQRPSNDVV